MSCCMNSSVIVDRRWNGVAARPWRPMDFSGFSPVLFFCDGGVVLFDWLEPPGLLLPLFLWNKWKVLKWKCMQFLLNSYPYLLNCTGLRSNAKLNPNSSSCKRSILIYHTSNNIWWHLFVFKNIDRKYINGFLQMGNRTKTFWIKNLLGTMTRVFMYRVLVIPSCSLRGIRFFSLMPETKKSQNSILKQFGKQKESTWQRFLLLLQSFLLATVPSSPSVFSLFLKF